MLNSHRNSVKCWSSLWIIIWPFLTVYIPWEPCPNLFIACRKLHWDRPQHPKKCLSHPAVTKHVWEYRFCSSIIPLPHAHLVLWKNTILVGSVFPSSTSDETEAVRHQSSAQRQKSSRKMQNATPACSSKGLFQLELIQRHLSCQSWDLEFRATLSLLHLLLHDLFLCFFNSSPAFSDFWRTGWWHLAHTLPQMQWFNICVPVSFKSDFVLPATAGVWRVLQMAAYLTCWTSPHARSLFLFSWVPSCSRLSLSNCLCWGTLWRKLIAWIIYIYTW